MQFLDEEVDLSTSFHFPEDNLISGSSNNDKENQQNNLLNISNQQDNNSNCNELSNAENNDDMETDHIIKEDVIRVRHDLFNRSSSSPVLAQVRRVMQRFRPILCLRNCAYGAYSTI